MCGKFTQHYSWRDIHAFSQPLGAAGDPAELVVATPMRFASIMRLGAGGAREMVQMRWGFAGRDDTNPSRPKHMHARAETIDTLPTFADSFAHARGILMVQTFNEGEELPNGKTKQWVITPGDGAPVAIAVVCQEWRNGPETLDTFVMVTVPSNPLIGRITDRMPAVLPHRAWASWLGETEASLEDIKALLTTYDDGGAWGITEQEPTSGRPRRPGQKAQGELF
jgi:putative SOS response-associated peptidase YedK